MLALSIMRSIRLLAVMLVMGVGSSSHAAESRAGVGAGSEAFAVVGTTTITWQEYQNAFASAMRQKYYHARPPEREVAVFQREVGDRLVNRLLLLEEARRRGIGPDREGIKRMVEGYDKRYAKSAQWQENRDKMLPPLIADLEVSTTVEALEKRVRDVPAPTEQQIRAHYTGHPEQFTEPEQVRIGIILLKVDPSSTAAVWDSAMAEAKQIHARLVKGAAFGELARMHSADASADKGGDLGYVHRGMLPDAVQSQVIDVLKPGQFSAPVRLLEGVAIVRLEDRKQSELRAFEDVKTRAADLLRREQGEKAWTGLIAGLRRKATFKVDESRFLPLVDEAKAAAPAQATSAVPASGAREERRVPGAKAGG